MAASFEQTVPLILASSSPRRRELLAVLIDEFEVLPADIDETKRSTESPEAYVLRMAQEKAAAVAKMQSGQTVLGADTTVVMADECLGKPQDHAEARHMLLRMSGTSHPVLSAVAVVDASGQMYSVISATTVHFADLPEEWVERYVASGEPMDKAGAYGIQGAASSWIERIEGSYTGVVGLPLFETARLLRTVGYQV